MHTSGATWKERKRDSPGVIASHQNGHSTILLTLLFTILSRLQQFVQKPTNQPHQLLVTQQQHEQNLKQLINIIIIINMGTGMMV